MSTPGESFTIGGATIEERLANVERWILAQNAMILKLEEFALSLPQPIPVPKPPVRHNTGHLRLLDGSGSAQDRPGGPQAG